MTSQTVLATHGTRIRTGPGKPTKIFLIRTPYAGDKTGCPAPKLVARDMHPMLWLREFTVKYRRVFWKNAIGVREEVASVLAFLMTPVSLAAYALAFWRLAADLNWAGEFFIESGLFSRWQVWLAIAIAAHLLANQIGRYDRQDRTVLQ